MKSKGKGRQLNKFKDITRAGVVLLSIFVIFGFANIALAEDVNRYATSYATQAGDETAGGWTAPTEIYGRPDDSFDTGAYITTTTDGTYIEGKSYGSTDLGTFISARVIICYDHQGFDANDIMYFKYSPDNGANYYTLETFTSPDDVWWTRKVYAASNIDSWSDLANTRIRVEYDRVGTATSVTIRVDAAFVQVTYSERYVPQDLSSTGLNILNFDGVSKNGETSADGDFTEAAGQYTFRGEDFDGLTALGSYVQGNSSPVLWKLPTYTTTAYNFVRLASATDANFTDGVYDKIHTLAAVDDADTASLIFTVTYTDATTDTYTITVEDWDSQADNYAGYAVDTYDQKVAFCFDYRHYWNGTSWADDDGTPKAAHLFHYTFDIDKSKTLDKLTIPADTNLRVMAITLEKCPEYKWAYEEPAGQRWWWSLTGMSGGSYIENVDGYDLPITTDSSYLYEGSTAIKYHFTHQDVGDDYAWSLIGTDTDGSGTPPDDSTERDAGKNVAFCNQLEFYIKGDADNTDTEDVRIELKDNADIATSNKITPTKWFLKSEDGSNYSNEITGTWKKVEVPFAAWRFGGADNLDRENMRYVGPQVNESAEPEGPVAFGNFTFYIDNLRFSHDGTKHFIYEDRDKPSDNTWDKASTGGGGGSSVSLSVNTNSSYVYQGNDSLKIQYTHVTGTGYTWAVVGKGGDNIAQSPKSWGDVYTGIDVSLYNQLEFWLKRVGTDDVCLQLEIKDTSDTAATNLEIHDYAGILSSDTNWYKVEIPLESISWGSCNNKRLCWLGFNTATSNPTFNSTLYIDNIQFAYEERKLKWAYEEDDDNAQWDNCWTGAGAGSSITLSVDTTTVYQGSDSIKIAYSITNDDNGWAYALITTEDDRTGFDAADAASRDAVKDITPFNALRFYVYGDTNADTFIELKDWYDPDGDGTGTECYTNWVQLSNYVTVSASWQEVTIPYTAWTWDGGGGTVDKSRIRIIGFNFNKNLQASGSYNLYIDNVHFVNSYLAATAVTLTDFNAIGYFGKVKLFWKTEAELNNLGFNILRSEDGKNYVKINPELIKGLGTPILGREYTYEDTDVVDGKRYYYLLEDVETSGQATKHGPVTAHPGRDFDNDGMTDDWEYFYGLPATVYDADVDSDDDGLTNVEEFLAGTNPLVIDSENFALSSQNSGVAVIESAGLRTVLELNTSTLKVTNKNVDGVIYHVITLPEYTHGQTTDVGKPQIPTKGVLFGTLSKKPVTINVLESEKETFTGYNVYPVPKAVLAEDPNDPDIKRLTYEFYKDTNAYAINAFYPSTLAEVDYSNYLQDQQVIKIIFHPVRFNPMKGTLEFYKRIRVEVLQEGAEVITENSSVTPKSALPFTEDNAYKIYITEEGIYRLTKSYLESQGMSLTNVDPTKLKIYNQGSEIPIYVFGEEDGRFDTADYIEFYAQAVDTRYTGTNVYWLVLSDSSGLRMTQSAQDESATTTPGSFLETCRKEDTTLYWMESKGQDHWFIDAIYGFQVYDLALTLNDVANTTNEATLKIAVEGSIYSGGTFAHHLYARLNGYPIDEVTWKGDNEYIINAKVSQSYLNEGENTVTLEVGEDYTGYEEILVNWVEVSYWRKYVARDNFLAFGNYTDGAYLYKVTGFTGQDVEIYDVTDAKDVKRITQFTVLPEGSTFTVSFKDIGNKEYIVLAEDKAKLPSGVSLDEPSNLADKKNRVDYIIITHSDFYDTILPFAEYRSNQGLKVKVVKVDDIYDEFNYGIADVSAIKDFLKYAYYNWTGPKPAYVLLVGDATFDYRDYSGYGFTNYVPTYLVHSLTFGETGSDNWFVCFDGESDVIPDMLIGRFPVKTKEELQAMINKIKSYESVSPDEEWTKKVLLVADDEEVIFRDTSENLASYLTTGYTADKQYLGKTTSRPDVLRQNIINSINDGRLFVNYAGHGGIGLWANERIFTWNDVNYLYNQYTLPVVTTLTCANGYFVYPRYIESLGERLINAPSGGAIACLVPSGISYPTTQAYLADGFYGAFFDEGDAILGSMVARGKLRVYENESGGDAINVIQTYVLFGDPALRVRMKAPQIPPVAAPEVFNLDKGKVNTIFRLTEESQAESRESGTVIVSAKAEEKDKGPVKKGLTKIIHGEEEVSTSPSTSDGALEDKALEQKGLDIGDIQLEDKTVALAPPKWKVLSKADSGTLKVVKPFAKIDYGTLEQSVANINKDARQLAELRAKFDEAVKAADLQKAKVILRQISKLARKIYWRKF